MKQLLYLTVFCLSWSAYGQNNQLKGTLSSAEGVLSFANIFLLQASDSTLEKAALTNENGQFSFSNFKDGTYFIQASYLGLKTYNSPQFNMQGDNISLDPISLEKEAQELEAVTVSAIKPIIEVMADRTVFNIENTIGATGTNGFELLRKAPGVIIDNNNSIILEGKTGVQIYINNKPSPLAGEDLNNYLTSLQASDIEAIEIITQPSSKYDAAGNAGIINIRLKKDKRLGTNGSINAGITQGRNTRSNTSISFNHRSKSANLFGSLSDNRGKSWSFLYLDRFQEGVRYDSETETTSDNINNNLKLGVDFFPGTYHTVGVLLNGNFLDGSALGATQTPIIPLNTGNLDQLLLAGNESTNKNANIMGNLNYRFADTLGHELLIDLDYGQYNRDANNFQPNQYLDGSSNIVLLERNFRMNTPIDIQILAAQFDYSQNLLGGAFSVGAKFSKVITDNIFEFYDVVDQENRLNVQRSNQFKYTESINAAYFNYNKKWKKWNLQVGLRAEQTISEGDLTSVQQNIDNNVKRNYLNWFPSGGLTYAPSWKSSWALTFSRRIQRPNYQTLNPFENQLDELSFAKGNPFLQPQYTSNLKISHTHKYRLTTSLSYSYIEDFFAQITDTLGARRNFLTTLNIANQEVINLGISYPFDMKKWWSVYFSLNAYHSSYESVDERFMPINQSTLSLYAQNTFSLPKDFKLEVSGWFNSPSVWGGTYLTKSMGSLNLAIQRKFFKDRISARLAVNDILFTSPWVADMQFGELYIDGTGGWESRNVRLNLSYNFGNKQVKAARKRQTSLKDENDRVGN